MTDVFRLGEQIVASLSSTEGRPDEPDLLSRWIAYEVADAIAAVEKAKSATARNRAVSAATDLILKLWTHRTQWPGGWPPEKARAAVAMITAHTQSWEPEPEPTGTVWVDRYPEFHYVLVDQAQLWWKLGLLELGVEDSRALLDRLPQADQDEEPSDIKFLRRNVEMYDEAAAWAKANGAKSKSAIRGLARTALRELNAKRNKLVREALNRGSAQKRTATARRKGSGERRSARG